jgi:hypothetical protein
MSPSQSQEKDMTALAEARSRLVLLDEFSDFKDLLLTEEEKENNEVQSSRS